DAATAPTAAGAAAPTAAGAAEIKRGQSDKAKKGAANPDVRYNKKGGTKRIDDGKKK
uniref:50S ribosomal protein L2 n=1 Tax=Globodera pallida TaxID=36090 RepID=A0A183CLW2_GLOPA